MFKKILIVNILLIFFTSSHAEEFKIVYLNVDKIMQESVAGKSIKKKLEKLYSKDLEKFKKDDENLKKKEKKIIAQKNILSQGDFQKELSNLRQEIINFQREQVKSRDDINKLRIKATTPLITKLSPLLEEYAKKKFDRLNITKKKHSNGKKRNRYNRSDIIYNQQRNKRY